MGLGKKVWEGILTECNCSECKKKIYSNDFIYTSKFNDKGQNVYVFICKYCGEINSFYGKKGLDWKRAF